MSSKSYLKISNFRQLL